MLDATGYQMNVAVLDSSLLVDTLCFSVATNIITPPSSLSVNVFPNPASDDLLIKSSLPLLRVTCLSQMGEIIYSNAGKNALQIQVQTSDLPGGIYFLEIKTVREISYEKIIVYH